MRSTHSEARIVEETEKLKVAVDGDWLRSHLDSRNLAVLDTRTRTSYSKSHIPGAIHADLFHYFIPGTDKRGLERFRKELADRLGKMGLTPEKTFVVYESKMGMRAARVAWMLEYAGVRRVLLLEGGYNAWKKSGFPTEFRVSKINPTVFRITPVSKVLATAAQVQTNHPAVILDVRSRGEFTGEEGRDCDERRGRIPNSLWIEWTRFLHDGSRFKSKREIGTALKEYGLSEGREIITYCHRGARAASAFYALKSLGYRNVKNYVGSWHEWSARKNLIVER